MAAICGVDTETLLATEVSHVLPACPPGNQLATRGKLAVSA